jgi:hypothetical protein
MVCAWLLAQLARAKVRPARKKSLRLETLPVTTFRALYFVPSCSERTTSTMLVSTAFLCPSDLAW